MLSLTKQTLKPKFIVEDPAFLPRHKMFGDAGHDCRIYIPDAEISVEDVARFNKHSYAIGEHWIYIDGEIVTDYRLIKEHMAKPQRVLIPPHSTYLAPLGFKVELPILPEPFVYMMKVLPRSGLASKCLLQVANAPGLIDPNYRGTVCAALFNNSDRHHILTHGARVAQVTLEVGVSLGYWTETDLITENLSETARGEGGFNSTGTA